VSYCSYILIIVTKTFTIGLKSEVSNSFNWWMWWWATIYLAVYSIIKDQMYQVSPVSKHKAMEAYGGMEMKHIFKATALLRLLGE